MHLLMRMSLSDYLLTQPTACLYNLGTQHCYAATTRILNNDYFKESEAIAEFQVSLKKPQHLNQEQKRK
jgi:hypothetical protein